MKNDTINRLYNLIKKFEKEKGSITTAVLFNSYDNYYRLMFASECLNSVGPYDATLEIVKYMKANDKDILKDLYFTITTVHTEDETIEELREQYNEGIEYLESTTLFYNDLSEVYIMI